MDSVQATKLALLLLTFGFAWVIMAYPGYADRMGWPVARWLRDNTSYVNIVGFMSVVGSPIAALLLFPWWTVFVVAAGGFGFGLAATSFLRAAVQYVAPPALAVCWVADIVYVLP